MLALLAYEKTRAVGLQEKARTALLIYKSARTLRANLGDPNP